MKRILIVDDHYIFRQGLKKIIADAFEPLMFGEAENSEAASRLMHNSPWDLVILDINLPGRSGLDFLKDVHSYKPELPVLVLSMYEEDQMALRAIKAGAMGYITKAKAAENLIGAIERILDGNKYITETVAELLVGEYKKEKTINVVKDLSDREYFILLRLAAGESVTEISRTLALSVKTISTYRSRIFKKLGLKSNIQLMQFAKDNNLG